MARVVGVALLMLLVGAGPATKPATTVYELRKQVDAMQAQLDELRTEIDSLRIEVARQRLPTTQPSEPTENKPTAGMTKKEIAGKMGFAGVMVYENAAGESEYKWPIQSFRMEEINGNQMQAVHTIGWWHVTFLKDKATSVERR